MGRVVKSISLSGGSLHFPYQIGVVRSFLDCGVHVEKVCATSAGTAPALYLLLDWRDCLSMTKALECLPPPDWGPHIESTTRCFIKGWWTGQWKPTPLSRARDSMLELFRQLVCRDPNAWRKLNGRLFITLCRWPSLRVFRICQWKSNEDLLECVAAATSIPWVTTPTACWWRNKRWVDGGFIDNHPLLDPCTVVITNQRFSQPWSLAWKCKPSKWGEISRPLAAETAYCIYGREYYHGIYRLGKEDGRCWSLWAGVGTSRRGTARPLKRRSQGKTADKRSSQSSRQ